MEEKLTALEAEAKLELEVAEPHRSAVMAVHTVITLEMEELEALHVLQHLLQEELEAAEVDLE